MAYDALAIANYFLDKAEKEGKSLTPMAVQKLTYFAHGWYLALMDQPLINQRVQAWDYGPVIAELYHEFKDFGKDPITRKAVERKFEDSDEYVSLGGGRLVEPTIPPGPEHGLVRSFLDRVWNVYGGFTAIQLSNLTHQDDEPWTKARQQNPVGTRYAIIDDELIKASFKAKAQANVARREPAQV
jgi:uncharacterized phage-associated protein